MGVRAMDDSSERTGRRSHLYQVCSQRHQIDYPRVGVGLRSGLGLGIVLGSAFLSALRARVRVMVRIGLRVRTRDRVRVKVLIGL